MSRPGFTLVEMILVMVLIVAAASIAAPLVDSMFHPNQVSAAVDSVRSQLAQARSRSMEEGRAYKFSIMESSGQFKIEPDEGYSDEAGVVIEGELPEPCYFVEPGRMELLNSVPSSTGAWKTLAVFLPDGTARDDAEISFGRAGLMPATLKLRALTGAVSQVIQPKEAP